MSPITEFVGAIKAAHWGWKIAGGFLAGMATTLPVGVAYIQAPIQANAKVIQANSEAIQVWSNEVVEVRTLAEANARRNAAISAQLARVLCNQNPAKTWQQCEIEHPAGD